MLGNDIFGSGLFGSNSTGGEMTFTPISKNTTYLQIMDLIKMQTGTFKNPLISDPFLIKQISISQQNIQIKTPEIHYLYKEDYDSLTITGTSNPYICDLSAINPYILRPELFIHITGAGVRTIIIEKPSREAEDLSVLTSNATSLFGTYRGDNLRLFKGSSFTITTSTDTVLFEYVRQTIAGSVTSASYIDLPDSMIQILVSEVVSEVVKYAK